MFTSVRSNSLNNTLFVTLFALMISGIFSLSFSSQVAAQGTPPSPTVRLTARLMGQPIQNIRPRGAAAYSEFSNGTRILTVAVDNVRAPINSVLDVYIDDSNVGQINLRLGSGTLRLSTQQGNTVPTPGEGSTVAVKRGDQNVLAGQLSSPPAPPTSRLFAPMEGAPVDGVAARGVAHYAEFGGDNPDNIGSIVRKLAVFVHRVNAAGGSTLVVVVDGVPVGTITLNDEGDGALRLNSENGDAVPEVSVDSTVSVQVGDAAVLAGTFREFDRPLPPRFRRNRLFGGRMSGRQVVPMVETEARGRVIVVVDRQHQRIAVKYAFRGLSGAQTSAAIHGPAHRGENAEVIFELNTVGGTQGTSGFQTFDVTPEQIAQLRTGHWYIKIGSEDHPDGEIRGQIRGRHRRDGFMGDDTADVAVYRPSNGTFYVKNGAGYISETIGRPGDVQISGDYDGDGTTDFAVFGNGSWLIKRSSDNGMTTRQFGLTGDIPVQGDFDGDGRSDLSVFRPSNGYWYILKSAGGYSVTKFGTNGDMPVASDFDGDGQTDIAVFRSSNGTWHWLKSSDGAYGAAQFGTLGDTPIRGDFDGDGLADLSVFRNSTGVWYTYLSSNGGYDVRQFGLNGDIPSAADFDGDGTTDFAVFRPASRTWYFWNSSTDSMSVDFFGSTGDIPATGN